MASTERGVLYAAHVETTKVGELQQTVADMRRLAKLAGLDMHNFAMSEGSCEADRIEALANDFLEAGYPVEFDDGVTVYAL